MAAIIKNMSQEKNNKELNKEEIPAGYDEELYKAQEESIREAARLREEEAREEEKRKEQVERITNDPEATEENKTEAREADRACGRALDEARETRDRKIERAEAERVIKEAIDTTLKMIEDTPAEERTDREIWVIDAVKKALDRRDENWQFTVEGLDEDGQPAYSEKEGVPADGLIEFLDKRIAERNGVVEAERERLNRAVEARQQQREEWIKQGDKDPDSYHQLKMSWHAVYEKFDSDDPLRAEVDALRDQWLEADRQNRQDDSFAYDENDFKLQTGEALRQVIVRRDEDLLKKINEVDNLIDRANTLEDNSENFSALHPKVAEDPQKLKRRTKMEARDISGDQRGQARREGKNLNDPAIKRKIMRGDWYQAQGELEKRREIVLPPAEAAPKGVLMIELIGNIPEQIPFPERKQITYSEPKQLTYRPEKYSAHIVNIDEIVRSYAMRIADEKVRQMEHAPEEGMRASSRVRSFLNNLYGVVRHPVNTARKSWLRLAENSYRTKFYMETLNQITSNQNLMLEIVTSYRLGRPVETSDPNLKKDLNFELLDKVMEEYEQNVEELEEKGEKVNDPRMDTAMKDLIYRHLSEGWDRERFENEQRTVINNLRDEGLLTNEDFLGKSGRNANEVGSGLMYATNLFKIAEDYKTHIDQEVVKLTKERQLTPEQKEKLAEHIRGIMKLDIELGAKFSDLHNKRPAGNLRGMERFVNWTQNTPIIRRIASNPGSVAFITALMADQGAKGVARRAVKGASYAVGVATGALLPVISAAGLGGVFGYARRSRDMKHDRAMHQNQRILGQKFGDYRRGQMERFQYDIASAQELQKDMDIIKQTPEYDALSDEQRERLASTYARFKVEYERDLDYRVRGRRNRTVDLISVDREEGGKYGTNYMAKTDLKADLYAYLRNNNLIPPDRTGLLTDDSGRPADTEFNRLVMENYARFNGDIDHRDREFESHRRRSSAVMGVFAGAGAGLAVMGVQELSQWWHGGHGYTAIDAMRGKDPRTVVSGGGTAEKIIGKKVIQEHYFEGGGKLNVGHNVIDLKGEKFDIVMSANGKIDGKASLLPKGWSVRGNNLVHMAPEFGKSSVIDASNFKEWAEHNFKEKLDRITYTKYLYEGTPPEKGIRALPEKVANMFSNKKLHANLTELMMQYGQDKNGNVYVDVSKMFGKTLKAAAGDHGFKLEDALKSGKKMFLTFSLDNSKGGTQFTPIKIEIGQDGKAIIPEKLKDIFFGIDKNGKLLQGPQYQRGLQSLIIDTGEVNDKGARKVWEVASVYGGQKPEISNMKEEVIDMMTREKDIPVTATEAVPPVFATEEPAFAAAAAGTPRWQLESEVSAERPGKTDNDDKRRQGAPRADNKGRVVNEDVSRKDVSGEEEVLMGEAGRTAEEKKEEEEKVKTEKTDANAEEKVRVEEFYPHDTSAGEKTWEINKQLFAEDNLREILKIKMPAWMRKILDRLNYYVAASKAGKAEIDAKDAMVFKLYYKRFLKLNPQTSLSFAEFNYCLKKGLEEFLNEVDVVNKKTKGTRRAASAQEIEQVKQTT